VVTKKPVSFEDLLVPFSRNGKVEDIYWTFCYSPAFDENNKVGGVLVTCMETTRHLLLSKAIRDSLKLLSNDLIFFPAFCSVKFSPQEGVGNKKISLPTDDDPMARV
jgi:hypothetical protein